MKLELFCHIWIVHDYWNPTKLVSQFLELYWTRYGFYKLYHLKKVNNKNKKHIVAARPLNGRVPLGPTKPAHWPGGRCLFVSKLRGIWRFQFYYRHNMARQMLKPNYKIFGALKVEIWANTNFISCNFYTKYVHESSTLCSHIDSTWL